MSRFRRGSSDPDSLGTFGGSPDAIKPSFRQNALQPSSPDAIRQEGFAQGTPRFAQTSSMPDATTPSASSPSYRRGPSFAPVQSASPVQQQDHSPNGYSSTLLSNTSPNSQSVQDRNLSLAQNQFYPSNMPDEQPRSSLDSEDYNNFLYESSAHTPRPLMPDELHNPSQRSLRPLPPRRGVISD